MGYDEVFDEAETEAAAACLGLFGGLAEEVEIRRRQARPGREGRAALEGVL